MREVSIDLREYGFKIHKYDTGEVVAHQKGPPTVDESAPVFNGHRGELHEIVFEYARELGIEIKLERKAVGYFEDEDAAGVEFEDGEKVGSYLSEKKRGTNWEIGNSGSSNRLRRRPFNSKDACPRLRRQAQKQRVCNIQSMVLPPFPPFFHHLTKKKVLKQRHDIRSTHHGILHQRRHFQRLDRA